MRPVLDGSGVSSDGGGPGARSGGGGGGASEGSPARAVPVQLLPAGSATAAARGGGKRDHDVQFVEASPAWPAGEEESLVADAKLRV